MSLLLPLLIVTTWALAVRVGWFPKSLIAAPGEVALTLWSEVTSGALATHALVSLRRLAVGFAVGTASGIFLGATAGLSQWAEKIMGPTFRVLAPVPPVAWIPLFIIAFGIEDASKVTLIASGAFFIVFNGTYEGFRSTDRKYIEVARLYEKSRAALLFEVLLFSAAPRIVASARTALGLSWTLLLAGELIASSQGLGWFIWDSRNFSRPDDMIAGMIAVGLLGGGSDLLMARLQSYVSRWDQTFEGL